MKNILFTAVLMLLSLLLLPVSAIKDTEKNIPSDPPEQTLQTLADAPEIPADDTFRLLLKDKNEIITIDAEEYIIGVVSAEMPALYDTEALKAQAVAAYTYACRKRAAFSEREYDISDDFETDQCYIDTAAAKKKWGDGYEQYSEKIGSAVRAVKGEYLEYDSAPALTVYHAISSGVTESCKNVWGSAISYLIPVESTGDKLSDGYLSTVTLSESQLSEKLGSLCELSGDASKWFSSPSLTESGRVKSIKLCGTELTGAAISKALSLRSANFTVTYKDKSFTFEVKGYGHGVGMSQFGADYMAKQGSTYKDILAHYYPGCTLKTNK